MPQLCAHLEQARDVPPHPPDGCAECLQSGDTWVPGEHWRLCYVDEVMSE
jgi:hypothetical protein